MQPSASSTGEAILHADALASVPRALTALVYQYRSLRSARRFVEKFFLSREVDLRSMIKFRDPKQTLLATVEKFGRERPVSRYVSLLLWVAPTRCFDEVGSEYGWAGL